MGRFKVKFERSNLPPDYSLDDPQQLVGWTGYVLVPGPLKIAWSSVPLLLRTSILVHPCTLLQGS